MITTEGEKILFKLLIRALILSEDQILACADDEVTKILKT